MSRCLARRQKQRTALAGFVLIATIFIWMIPMLVEMDKAGASGLGIAFFVLATLAGIAMVSMGCYSAYLVMRQVGTDAWPLGLFCPSTEHASAPSLP